MDSGKSSYYSLCATQGRVIIKVDIDGKNWHSFQNGTIIRYERFWNNLDRRHTIQTLAEVVQGENIPVGAEVLIHHNAVHEVSRIFNHKQLSGEDEASTIRYFSIPETQCYLWKMPNEDKWMPLKGYATALRVFQPVKTQFYGIAPNLIKNTLFITSGEHEGKIVRTLKACDYEIIFRNSKGIEEKIIRCRHFEDCPNEREEIIAIDHKLTKLVANGEYYVGISVTDAKPLSEYYEKKEESKLII